MTRAVRESKNTLKVDQVGQKFQCRLNSTGPILSRHGYKPPPYILPMQIMLKMVIRTVCELATTFCR